MATSPLLLESIENEFLRVDYLTTTGPRIIGLYAKGVEGNLFAETPNAHWPTPHGEYYLRGGHRLWTAPENPFYNCPEEQVSVVREKHAITLKSPIDPSGLEKEISFRLDENCVLLKHKVTWHRREPVELASWGITQLRLGGMAILPQSNSGGLQPNRNLVFWPYSQLDDERLELHDDLIIVHGCANEQAFKLGYYNSQGWTAYLLGNIMFVKRFSVDHFRGYPDMGCNVEAYVKDTCLEIETLGPLTTLKPKESMTLEETWEVRTGDYPPTLESAHKISQQLSLH